MTNYSHLHPDVVEQIEKSDEERIKWIKQPRWIGYPRAHEVIATLEDLLIHPREPRMPNVLLIGNTNNGKTQLIRHFAQRHPPDDNVYGEHIIAPVLYVQAPPTPSESGLYTEILKTLFERVPAASNDARRSRVVQVLQSIQVKILIIDELHNILAGSSIKQQQFLNIIKYLSNELQISIVGCGTGDLLRAISIDPQIQNRFTPELLPKWQLNKEFRQLLMSFERTLPLKKPSNLHNRLIATRALALSEGTIGELSVLLNSATTYAIKNGIEFITSDALSKCGYVSPSDRTRMASRL
mgnify:CR=1 FL=1